MTGKIKASGFDSVVRYVESQSENYVRAFLDDLDAVGMKVVSFVRARSKEESWEDQTGNLRSSIGYVIVRNGAIVRRSGFEKVDGPKRDKATDNGSVIGAEYAEKIAKRYTKGYALVIVAGMNYASYVEDMENKDVLAGGKIQAEKLVAKLIADYKRMKSK